MDTNERAKLLTLLNYWIEHSQEHSQEFKDWADKLKGLGETATGEELRQAAGEMDKAGESLSQALRRLEAKE